MGCSGVWGCGGGSVCAFAFFHPKVCKCVLMCVNACFQLKGKVCVSSVLCFQSKCVCVCVCVFVCLPVQPKREGVLRCLQLFLCVDACSRVWS